MNACILMPKELSLMLLPSLGRNVMDMDVTLWAKQHLRPGLEFRADEGEAVLERLELYSRLHKNDVRRCFGGFDEILSVENEAVRHCNWVRFLRSSSDMDQVNMVARLTQDQQPPTFQVVKRIRPNDEIKAFFAFELPGRDHEGKLGKSACRSPTDSSKTSSSSSSSSSITKSSFVSSHSSGFFGSPPSLNEDLSPSSKEFKPLDLRFRCDEEASGNEADDWKDKPEADGEKMADSPPKKRKTKTWLPCESCGKKFDRPSLLKRHIRTHTGEKPHSCETCGKAFSTSSSLNTHRRIHSGERPHECPVCGKRFTASSNLYYHRMTHKKEKPHKCTICSKSFPTPGDLKSHQYTHSGSWPFKCNFCGRGFSKMANLKNHLLVHRVEEQNWSQESHRHSKTSREQQQQQQQVKQLQQGLHQTQPPLSLPPPPPPPNKRYKNFSIESLVNPDPGISCS